MKKKSNIVREGFEKRTVITNERPTIERPDPSSNAPEKYDGFPGSHRPNMIEIHEKRKELSDLSTEFFDRTRKLKIEIYKVFDREKEGCFLCRDDGTCGNYGQEGQYIKGPPKCVFGVCPFQIQETRNWS